MQRTLINILPPPLLLLTIMITMSSAATLIFFATKKFFPPQIEKKSRQFLSLLIGLIIGNYTILVGFMIINLWQNYQNAKLIVVTESNHLALMTYDAFALPPVIQSKLLDKTGHYIHHLIDYEWPAMKWGESAPITNILIHNFFTTLASFTPQTEIDKAFYQDFLQHLNGALENRRLRLYRVDNQIEAPLLFILIFGILLNAFLLSLLHSKNKYIHIFTIVITTSILSFKVGVTLLLDFPFSGRMAVSSSPLKENILSRYQ